VITPPFDREMALIIFLLTKINAERMKKMEEMEKGSSVSQSDQSDSGTVISIYS